MRRKHLEIDQFSIHYIGKESNKLKNSEVLGAFKEDALEYVDSQERLREIISKLTLKDALNIGISRRTHFDWKKKISQGKRVSLKDKTFQKFNNNSTILL